MFFSFYKKRKQVQVKQGATPNLKTIGLRQKCHQLQSYWATYLQHQSEKLSLFWKKLGITVFCLLCSGYCLYLVVNNVPVKQKIFKIETLKIPKQSPGLGELKFYSPSLPYGKNLNFLKAEEFWSFLNNRTQSSSGKARYDSLLNKHPKLIDSMYQIEKQNLLPSFKK